MNKKVRNNMVIAVTYLLGSLYGFHLMLSVEFLIRLR
jgi:hypothetical protein